MTERFDDEHRGPGVADAMQLSDCWLALTELARQWPEPATRQGREIEGVIRATYPEGQVERAVAEHRRSEGTVDVLRHALLDGVLPLWVASKDGAAIPVAPNALLELGRETIITGVYRPFNDRGWLHGRPLFVKKGDFLAWRSTLAEKRAEQRCPQLANDRLPRLSEGDLRKWWARLSMEDRSKSQEELASICRAAHPKHSVSRQRIRDLDPGRKRGPKPIRR